MRLKRERSVYVELVCIRGWRALAVRDHSQWCRGVFLPREEIHWLVGEMRQLLLAPTGPIPVHIARAWGPLRVLVSPKGVRLWRRSGSWPVEGVAIAATEARDVAALLGKHGNSITKWLTQGLLLERDDPAFKDRLDLIDAAISSRD